MDVLILVILWELCCGDDDVGVCGYFDNFVICMWCLIFFYYIWV